MRGRKPTPSILNDLRGNPGKRPRDLLSEPHPGALREVPPAPRYLDGRAARYWRELAGELVQLKLLTPIDLAPLAVYCAALSQHAHACEELKAKGTNMTISGPRGVMRSNPLLKIREDAAKTIAKYAAEFGMTPSSRSRVKAADAPQQKKLFAELDSDDDVIGNRPELN